MVTTVLIALTLVIQVVVVTISILPFIPGPLLLWLVNIAFAFLNDFERLPPIFLIILTVLMLMGMTTGLWMPLLGMKAQGVSCWGTLGMLIGGLIGTFVVPIPVCGTLVGAILGALAFELVNAGSMEHAVSTGKAAFKTFILEMFADFTITLVMFGVFLVSLWVTG